MIRLLILFLALSFGGLTAWLAFDRLPAMTAAQQAADGDVDAVPMIDVLVAQSEITGGSPLEDGSMMWQQWPETAIDTTTMITRPDYDNAIAELSGSLVRSRIIRGEPIQRNKLAAADSGFLAAILPLGKRAVSVRISAENSAGGFILPNDHVDVVFTRSRTSQEGNELFSRSYTIARNLRVVAIDQTVSDDTAEVSFVGKTATLEVDPEQAETIAAAQAAGSLSLALRPAQDSGALAKDSPVILSDLVSSDTDSDTEQAQEDSEIPTADGEASDPAEQQQAAPAAATIRVIGKGGTRVVTLPARGDS